MISEKMLRYVCDSKNEWPWMELTFGTYIKPLYHSTFHPSMMILALNVHKK